MKYLLFKKYSIERSLQMFVHNLNPIKHELIKYLISGKQIKYDKSENKFK